MGLGCVAPNWAEIKSDYWFSLVEKTPRDQLATELQRPEKGAQLSEDAAMFLAYAEALRGAGSVSPNPLVGAVVLDRNSTYLSSGAHLRLGGAHAEIEALNQVDSKQSLVGGSLFVTLEPCSHYGRTPPCADVIAHTGIKKIFFGLRDPNPAVNGTGEISLSSAGKIVKELKNWRAPCEWLARVFLKNQREQQIFVGMKVASTESGVMAGNKTSRLWITNERSRQMGHFLRLEYDAICIGAGTALLDDPMLDVRHPKISGRMPLRVVLDGEGQLFKSGRRLRVFTESPDHSLIVVPDGSSDVLEKTFGVKVLRLPCNAAGEFNWKDIGQYLWQQGVKSLLLEGGAKLYKTALRQSMVDALHWFVAPDGGSDGLKWPVNPTAFEIYKKGGGAPLEGDRLVEFGLRMGECHFV